MAQLTVRGVPEDLKQGLEREAKDEGLSLNRMALEALRLGLTQAQEVKARRQALERFVGMWTHEEAAEVRQRLADTERIDEEMWR
jgi:plasmid stability protein